MYLAICNKLNRIIEIGKLIETLESAGITKGRDVRVCAAVGVIIKFNPAFE